MQIIIHGMAGEEIVALIVEPRATFRELLAQVAATTALSPDVRLTLVLGGTVLPANAGLTLEGLGINDGAVLTLVKERVRTILTAGDDGMAKIWSTISGECLLTLEGHSDVVSSAVFSGFPCVSPCFSVFCVLTMGAFFKN